MRRLQLQSLLSPVIRLSVTSLVRFLINLRYFLANGFSIVDTTCVLRGTTARASQSPPPLDLVNANETFSFHLWVYPRHRSRELIEWTKGLPTVSKEMLSDHVRIFQLIEASASIIDCSLVQ
ncbi:hypothetical protein BDV32DRAFT_129671 [Aspergillus pseudonomiae]|nr:hypothetical protein BDV32DRAFT_129671 [Aspergillus pseudonomiae]